MIIIFSNVGSNTGHGGEKGSDEKPSQCAKVSNNATPARRGFLSSRHSLQHSGCLSEAPKVADYTSTASWSVPVVGNQMEQRRTKEVSLESELKETIWFK